MAAPLYKRYIPPKPAGDQTTITQKPIAKPPHQPSPPKEVEKKRKRERSQEEVAQRKAKKLRSRGIDPATAVIQDAETLVVSQDVEPERCAIEDAEPVHNTPNQAQGEFAHVKNAKKRHKLEKEARKVRKAAEKERGTEDDGGEDANGNLDQDEERVEALAVDAVQESGAQDDQCQENFQRKRRREEQPKEEHVPEASPSHDVEGIAKSSVQASSQPKKRRHKLESVLAEAADQEPDDDEHLRKHTGILGKFQKSAKQSNAAEEQQEVQDEDPLKQRTVAQNLALPERDTACPPELPGASVLPAWLAKPTVVSSDSTAIFSDLGLDPAVVDRLAKLTFKDALPVQQVLIPLLIPPGSAGATFLPGTEEVLPDIAVSAPTGSGKTISYLLPIVESLRKSSSRASRGRLSALVIVPTRELVLQVAAVAEALTKGSGITVGMATGTTKFKDEQQKLIRRGNLYDVEGSKKLLEHGRQQINAPSEDSEEFENWLQMVALEDDRQHQLLRDALHCAPGHVPTYESAVDMLVATPGRLLEHVNGTFGFNLVHLKWLVIDEADQLLDNQSEGFLDALNRELARPRTVEEQDAREQYLRSNGFWDERRERLLRKVVLSATMTRDISKLTMLQLRRPKLIVVRGSEDDAQASTGAEDDVIGSVRQSTDGFELPRTLVEYCVPVGDGSEKPLVVVELLSSRIFGDIKPSKPNTSDEADADTISDDDSDDSSESDDSSSFSGSSDSSSDDESGSDEDEPSNMDVDEPEQDMEVQASIIPRHLSSPTSQRADRPTSLAPTILIFTSSNESATRLSHLLKGLKPTWSHRITTLIKSKPGSARIRSKPTEPAIVISTDRAARGLDSFSNRPITHVMQYDVPRSLTSYVHRVGRTARAGRVGEAWTLYTHSEAKWFIGELVKAESGGIVRKREVERVKIFCEDEGVREKYRTVLEGMRDSVYGGGGKE